MEAFSWTEWGVRWVLLPLLIHTIQGLNLLKTAVLFIAKSFAAKLVLHRAVDIVQKLGIRFHDKINSLNAYSSQDYRQRGAHPRGSV